MKTTQPVRCGLCGGVVVLGVALGALAGFADVHAQASMPAREPPAVRQAFDAFLVRFRAAVTANDAMAVAGLTQLPFMNDTAIADAAQFKVRVYAKRFTPNVRSCLLRGRPTHARDGLGNDTYAHICNEQIYVFTQTPTGFLLTDIDAND